MTALSILCFLLLIALAVVLRSHSKITIENSKIARVLADSEQDVKKCNLNTTMAYEQRNSAVRELADAEKDHRLYRDKYQLNCIESATLQHQQEQAQRIERITIASLEALTSSRRFRNPSVASIQDITQQGYSTLLKMEHVWSKKPNTVFDFEEHEEASKDVWDERYGQSYTELVKEFVGG